MATAQSRRTQGIGADGDMLSGSNHSSSSSFVREDGWMLALTGGYESPDKELRDIYKATPVFGLTVTRAKNHWLFSGSVDYRSYQPKQSTFVVSDDYLGTYNMSYGNFRGIGLYAGVAYDLQVNDIFDAYLGANVGSVFIKEISDMQFADGSAERIELKNSLNYLGPKLGLNFAAGTNLGIGVEGRYGLNVTGFNSNTRTGTEVYKGFSAASANLVLTYYF
ncbi:MULTISPECIES: hypothetical protein [unclassified Mucilaginibacter]|uniref:hypothetical protein n=1 Tax=unclassified Mucilaginibacter TaxID=2617802 RepID=UPI000966BB42|nr:MULTISPECIES: hypothetical protein [unclassified Mucilaginibacter]OJW15008.1 MAG: hypothetical protein BGO48_12660 [Mucilaginibacter sp. 44-25]PLW89449.1 MAG: hypothetical protein C0154_11515 [Mucilaginibacter sp.]HEK21515.1 hypothetical protein [Bacteroidota bacterium]